MSKLVFLILLVLTIQIVDSKKAKGKKDTEADKTVKCLVKSCKPSLTACVGDAVCVKAVSDCEKSTNEFLPKANADKREAAFHKCLVKGKNAKALALDNCAETKCLKKKGGKSATAFQSLQNLIEQYNDD